MPPDFGKQQSDYEPASGNSGNSRMVVLALLTFSALITSFFLDVKVDTYPTAHRIALRINHNVTSAYLATNDILDGKGTIDLAEILLVYDRALGYVNVSLVGGNIDGVEVLPLKSAKLRAEMEEIGAIARQLKSITVDFLSLEITEGEAAEFDFLLAPQYSKLQEKINNFSTSSRSFLQRHRERFQIFQIILMVLSMFFVVLIMINSKRAQEEKSEALDLVKQLDERRKLAIEGANLGTWDWNISKGEFVFNERWAEMLGLDGGVFELDYYAIEKLIHPDDLPGVFQIQKDIISGKSNRLYREYRMWAQPGQWIWVLDLGKVLERDTEGKAVRAAGTLLDVTRIKAVELKLQTEKTRAQQYLDIAGVLFIALDTNGVVTMINPKGCQVLGVPADYVVGRNWMENFVPERIRTEIQAVADDLMDTEEENQEYYVNPIMTASGKEALIAWRNTVLTDNHGNITGHLSSGMDITRQRAHEIMLEKYQQRLQSLAAQLAITEDGLRQEIASGLHDSIGQNLAALKLSVDLIGLNLDNPESLDISTVKAGLIQASETIDKIVKETWSLSFQLSPPGLYESGIGSALEWLVSRFNEEYSCKFLLKSHANPLPREKDGRGLLFQMVRELLLNAVKKGKASEVEIALASAGQYILATVTDNGVGFDTTAALAKGGDAGGFGLFSIKERLAYISGTLEIDSTIGQGTRVVIRFPVGKIDFEERALDDENQNPSG